nr:hypothetical protein [uncultured Sphingobacterium sp.]
MEDFLYYKFVQLHNEGQLYQSYNQIKTTLKYDGIDIDGYMTPFYRLLEMGLIDWFDMNRFCLTDTRIIGRENSTYLLGINLNLNLEKQISNHVRSFKLGLTVIEKSDINIDHQYYYKDNLWDIIEVFYGLKRIVKYWKETSKDILNSSNQVEFYSNFKWITYNRRLGTQGLFKIYRFNEGFYTYLYSFGRHQYLINPTEFEKINWIKMYISRPLFKYHSKESILEVPSFKPIPVFLKKILFLEHVFNCGDFPKQNKYHIDLKLFKKLVKKLQLNYKVL